MSDTADDAPIFTCGAQRSGTTLLRTGLSLHSRVRVSDEAHFLRDVLAVDDRSLSPEARFERYWAVSTMLSSKRYRVDRSAARQRFIAAPAPDKRAFIRAVLQEDAAANGKVRWGAKVPDSTRAVPRLAEWFPAARFIWITRDPRAAVISRQGTRWVNVRDLSRLAKQWHEGVDVYSRPWQPDPRFLFIRYEDLVADWQGTVRHILDHVGEEPEDHILHPAPGDLGFNTSHEGRDAPRAEVIVQGQNERWRALLSDRDVWTIQRRTGSGMRRFRYEPIPYPLSRRSAWMSGQAVIGPLSNLRHRVARLRRR
jgi:hypothetical protein